VSWVFAYGSLMGDAALGRFPSQPARLPGYHRAFNHESTRRWGQPQLPCPILGLSPGGECWGVAFAIPAEEGGAVCRNVERREGARERRRETRTVETPNGPVEAWTWVSANGRATAEAVDPSLLEARLRAAHGVVGTGVEYVRTVVHALELHGLRDPLVDSLWERLRG
jgi:cation transport protein ChaC